jgi:hypothetical protein
MSRNSVFAKKADFGAADEGTCFYGQVAHVQPFWYALSGPVLRALYQSSKVRLGYYGTPPVWAAEMGDRHLASPQEKGTPLPVPFGSYLYRRAAAFKAASPCRRPAP